MEEFLQYSIVLKNLYLRKILQATDQFSESTLLLNLSSLLLGTGELTLSIPLAL